MLKRLTIWFSHIKEKFNLVLPSASKDIDEAGNTKFLGVYLDNKMNWKKHISYISGKVARGIGLIIKARKMLTCWLYIILLYSHTCFIVIKFGAAPTQQI